MSDVDLRALQIDDAPRPRRALGLRVLPFAALALALATALTFLWPLLRPVRAVPMTPVRATATMGAKASITDEAVGWVEADPFPTMIRPLVAGRIESIAVLEGADVEAGRTVLATLASASLRAAAERAEALVAERESELAAARAAHDLAKARLTQKAEARAAVLAADGVLAERAQRLAAASGAVATRAAEVRAALALVTAQERLRDAGTQNDVALERTRAASAGAEAAAASATAEHEAALQAHANAVAAQRLATELLERPVDLTHGELVAAAAVARAETALASARVDHAIAARELSWTQVTAPVDGRVLRLLAAPGNDTGPDHEAILALFDPGKLRARIDVPLGTVEGIAPGQDVELLSEVSGPAVVRGKVQRVQHESDLLKNTLQVKVALVDPPPLWRPETLCRARFLGSTDTKEAAIAAFLVPRAAVQGNTVFVFDPARGVARAVPVMAMGEEGDLVRVHGALSVAQRVILATVRHGEAVREQTP